MRQVIRSVNRNDQRKKLAVLRLEVDYELATLYEAMIENDEEKKNKCKQKLEKLRQEMMRIKI
jgi:hypothetical protein